MRRQRRSKQPLRFSDQRLDVDALPPALAAAAKSEDLVNELTSSLARAANFSKIAGRPASRSHLRIGHLGMAQDRTNDVIEVVCYSAGKGAYRLHPPGLQQIRLQPLLLLFEINSTSRMGDRVKCHAKEGPLTVLREPARAQGIKPEDRAHLRLRFVFVGNAQPALKAGIDQPIDGVIGTPRPDRWNVNDATIAPIKLRSDIQR